MKKMFLAGLFKALVDKEPNEMSQKDISSFTSIIEFFEARGWDGGLPSEQQNRAIAVEGISPRVLLYLIASAPACLIVLWSMQANHERGFCHHSHSRLAIDEISPISVPNTVVEIL